MKKTITFNNFNDLSENDKQEVLDIMEEANANCQPPEIKQSEEHLARQRKMPLTKEGICYADSYKDCCEKMQVDAQYYDIETPHSRVWLTSDERCEMLMIIIFSEIELINIQGMRHINLSVYSPMELGTLFEKYILPLEK